MKKFIAVSFVLAAGVVASFAYASSSQSEEVSKIPPCRASYYTCPDGSMSIKCNRKSNIEHPTCTADEVNGCYLMVGCR